MKSRLWEGEQRVKSAMIGIAVYKKGALWEEHRSLQSNYKRGSKKSSENKKRIKSFKNQGPEIFKQRLSASVNYEPGYGRVKKEKLKNYSGRDSFFHCNACI